MEIVIEIIRVVALVVGWWWVARIPGPGIVDWTRRSYERTRVPGFGDWMRRDYERRREEEGQDVEDTPCSL